MNVLGISAFYHDAAAALVVNGGIVAAAQEERFTRKKHDSSYPEHSIKFCLEFSKLRPEDIDYVAFYDKPFSKFERLLKTYFAFSPKGFDSFSKAMPAWVGGKLSQKSEIIGNLKRLDDNVDWSKRLCFCEHHLSHAASAFFPSPFERAAVLSMDGVGESVTTSLALGIGDDIQIVREIHFPHSLGLLYSAFTYHMGFKVNSGEYKVMGLAPYGKPIYANIIKTHLIDIKEDGSFRLNMDYFDYCTGFKMTNDRFDALFGSLPRQPEMPITQREMDLAASIQAVTEEVVLKLAGSVARETGEKNLCMAGGVALNCVANGKLLRKGDFENIWIQPAAGDAGGALGAALAIYYGSGGGERIAPDSGDAMKGGYLGPEYSQSMIEKKLTDLGARFEVLDDNELLDVSAQSLAGGEVVGWHQGRMEFGPRALGARSIIADPRAPWMQKTLNQKVKCRESFRPFAPSVLREDVSEWFDMDEDSPYMLFVANVSDARRIAISGGDENLFGIDKLNAQRSLIPAVTHVDYSARIQTVHRDSNSRYHELISRFKELSGCPVVVNTSFNVRGEPIVNTPEDAFRCFMGTDIDILVLGNCILRKESQDRVLINDYVNSFELD